MHIVWPIWLWGTFVDVYYVEKLFFLHRIGCLIKWNFSHLSEFVWNLEIILKKKKPKSQALLVTFLEYYHWSTKKIFESIYPKLCFHRRIRNLQGKSLKMRLKLEFRNWICILFVSKLNIRQLDFFSFA